MDDGRKLWLATLRVDRAAHGGVRDDKVHVVADDFNSAAAKACPMTGYASFELIGLQLIGRAQIASVARPRTPHRRTDA